MVSCVWEFDLGDGCFELVLAHIRSRGTASQQGLGSAWWAPERLLSHGLFESARWVLAERLSSGAWTPTVMGCVPSVFFPQRERQAQREDALELTEKLDQDWKEIQALLACKTPKSESGGGKEKPKVGRTRLAWPGLEPCTYSTDKGEPGICSPFQDLSVLLNFDIEVADVCSVGVEVKWKLFQYLFQKNDTKENGGFLVSGRLGVGEDLQGVLEF